ncbi:unnamed protein product [Rotaria sp. Silwood1]|nr:unnamed protein product [Rotaria sp. Silwood1]
MLRFTILLLCVLALLTIVETTNNRRCGALCRRRCLYGFVLNRNGCPTCRCKTSPCEDGRAPLPGYFCGRSPTRRDCPRNYACLIAPNDAYAQNMTDTKHRKTHSLSSVSSSSNRNNNKVKVKPSITKTSTGHRRSQRRRTVIF